MHGRKVQRKRHLIVFIELGTADMAWRRPANDDDSRVIDIVIAAGSASSAAAAAAAKPAARPGPARAAIDRTRRQPTGAAPVQRSRRRRRRRYKGVLRQCWRRRQGATGRADRREGSLTDGKGSADSVLSYSCSVVCGGE